ncbi:MAG: SDR family NAD(P)-dependent oxidoreductase [Micromonosporaceae bacterium]|nr:SDR family NAD(P)-dependent oxidoreductase [Micromonosporaceae bacterium]
MKDLDGRVAFVTGGNSGIGLGVARAFLDAGMKVALTYRSRGNLDEAMKSLHGYGDRVHALPLEVTDREATHRAADEVERVFGKVHVVVANAGVSIVGPISSTSYEDWDWAIGVNLGGAFNTIHTFLPRIRSHREGGHLVATASLAGLTAHPGFGAYTVSKFGVVGMMEALRTELAGSDIGVTVFCPGVVNSRIAHSGRNRPGGALPPPPPPPPGFESAGMDPDEAGQRVLRGIRNDDLYVLTTPEFEPELRARGEAILASLPTDVHAAPERVAFGRLLVGYPDYARERDRKLAERGSQDGQLPVGEV